MTFAAYMLRCSDGSFYVGHTDNLHRRMLEHSEGTPGYTYDRRPVRLVWSDTFRTREEALAAERRIKGWTRAKKEALVIGDRGLLKQLAAPPAQREARALRLRSGRTGSEEGIASPARIGSDQTLSIATPPPLIVLVRPQLGRNIGKAARAMLNFGLTELRLVAPRDGWPNPEAGPAASGADVVLERARVFDTLAEATADCAHVYATTVRRRGLVRPVMTPEEAAAAIRAGPGRTAILFGPERSGLETDEVAVARTIITVPINPEFGSLNLAQAVILCAYEWSKGQTLAQPPAVALEPPAPQAELDRLVAHLDGMLERAGYFHPPDHVATSRQTLRSLLTKPGWNGQEVRTLRGVLSTLERPRGR